MINECKVTHFIYNVAYLNRGNDNQFVGMSPRITVCLLSVPSVTDKSTNEVSRWCLTSLIYDAFAFIMIVIVLSCHAYPVNYSHWIRVINDISMICKNDDCSF